MTDIKEEHVSKDLEVNDYHDHLLQCLDELIEQIIQLNKYKSDSSALLKYCYFDMIDHFRITFSSNKLPQYLSDFEQRIIDEGI